MIHYRVGMPTSTLLASSVVTSMSINWAPRIYFDKRESIMPISKSLGVTTTEQLLADLCDRSFLKLWSYPNPFKDDRKELCDLLAVFENHVSFFSIVNAGISVNQTKMP
jgi:hypothetical protein